MSPGPGIAILAATAFIVAVWAMLVAAYTGALVCGLIAAGAGWVWRRGHV